MKIIPNDSLICNFCSERLVEIEPQWGISLIKGGYYNQNEIPEWLEPALRDNTFSDGVVIWDKQIHRVVRFWAYETLFLLEVFRTRNHWQDDGILVGEPILLMQEKPEGQWILNSLELSPNQAQELFDFLSSNEGTLKAIASSDENFTQSKINEGFRSAVGYDLWISLGLEELFQTDPQKAMKLTKLAMRKKGILDNK